MFYVLTRYAGRREGALALVLWAGVGALTVSTVGLIAFQPMALRTWLLLGLAGLLGTCGQLLMAGCLPPGFDGGRLAARLFADRVGDAARLRTVRRGAVHELHRRRSCVAASGIGVVRFSRLR